MSNGSERTPENPHQDLEDTELADVLDDQPSVPDPYEGDDFDGVQDPEAAEGDDEA